MAVPKSHYKQLRKLFASVQSEHEADMLLKDLLTPQEIDSLAERWQIIQSLAQNKTQREVAAKLQVSISKVTRGSRALQYGAGGFNHFLRKIKVTKQKKKRS